MSSRPRNLVLLIGAARAVPYPVSLNQAHNTSEPHVQDSATNDDTAGYVRLVALPPSSTADLANLVTPVTPHSSSTHYELTEITPVTEPTSSTPYELTEVTPVTTPYELTEITPVPKPTSTTSSELTEITPVPVPTSSPRTIFTISSVSSTPTTDGETPPQPILTPPSITIPATGQHIGTVTITDWVTVTLPVESPRPAETQMSDSETVPITIIPITYNSSASRRPDLPGGFLGGPPQPDTAESDEA